MYENARYVQHKILKTCSFLRWVLKKRLRRRALDLPGEFLDKLRNCVPQEEFCCT